MVRINAPRTPSVTIHNDADEPMPMDDAVCGNLPAANDFLMNHRESLIEGNETEYEIPNVSTYKKVGRRRAMHRCVEPVSRSKRC
jgi:hypothetical protein